MKLILKQMVALRGGARRKIIQLRPISAPDMMASDLYREAYKPIVDAWLAALPGLVEEYGRSASLTNDSAGSLAIRIEVVDRDVTGLLVALRLRLARWAERLEAWQRARWRANVLAATRVDLGTLLGPADARETLETVIERNVGLIRSVSDETRRRVSDAVYRGLQNRTPARDLARELRESVAIERRRALRIASDQTVTVTSQLNSERRRMAGIDSWEWISSGKLHPREHHRARNGNLYSENPDRHGTDYEGKRVNAPPPSDDLPGIPINCACTERSVLILD